MFYPKRAGTYANDASGDASPLRVAFGLGQHKYTPARRLIELGGAIALATDLNPGTCWCESMQFIIALACRHLHLTPAEAICAATANAAPAVSRANM